MMYSSDLYFLGWLTIKFVIDFISIIFIFWRLVYKGSDGGTGKHKGDFYFLTWLGVKFVVDFASIVYIIIRLKVV